MLRHWARVASRVGRYAGLLLSLSVPLLPMSGIAQIAPGPTQPLIAGPIDENNLVVLAGNTRPEAQVAANDLGVAPDNLPMAHMMLQLRRPAAQERALQMLIDQLHDPNSPNYHRWLSADQFGTRFGPVASDVQAITGWLQGQGFTINVVYPSRMAIDFSGTAGQVHSAFHTEIHNLSVNGVAHVANVSDPRIPAALAPAVAGVVSLHNFLPKPMFALAKKGGTFTGASDCFAAPGQCYLLTPPDVATIYNFNPVFTGGNTGQDQTIYLIEDSDAYSAADWTTFRSTFGLSGYTGASLNTIHPSPPSGPSNCLDPGVVAGTDAEVELDAEYASAAAPNAAIIWATCADTSANGFTFGGLIAIQNLINGSTPPAIISMSYGICEAFNGAAANAAYSSAYQQGVAEGASIFVSAGDANADICDYLAGDYFAQSGISVSGFASTPYNVAVGGTDYSDTYAGTNATYWNTSNTAAGASALSYIPEIPWNNSCGSQLIANFYSGSTVTYGPSGFCNSIVGDYYFLTLAGGSGGPSNCATGGPAGSGGSCQGWPKPSWQRGLIGNPNDGVRDLPDVSLFAANGTWNHYYVFCWSDTEVEGGAPCSGSPDPAAGAWSGAGGTSFAAPIWAGIQALINQKAGGRQGLPNYALYQMAGAEYGASGSSSCASNNGNTVGASCIFYDVTLDNNDVPCYGNVDCFGFAFGFYGVLSASDSAFAPAYAAGTGWDFATGIGTVNVANLVANWSAASTVGTVLTDAHDFNSDGKSDILYVDNGGNIALWLMNGGQVLQAAVLGNLPTEWSVVGQRDFAGNDFSSIVWRNTSGDLALWTMNGLQLASSAFLGNVATNWTIAGTGDLNGDGDGDLLWHDSNSGSVVVWFMNGSQVVSTASLGAVATNWVIQGDDSKGHIFWRDTVSGTVVIWAMNGSQVAGVSSLGAIPNNWTIQGLGDFNGDGIPDILWRDSASGTVVIWFLNSALQVQLSTNFGIQPSNWRIAQTGDYSGSGSSDILWIDNSGDLAVWLMHAGQVASTASYGNVGAFSPQALNAE